LTEIKGHFFFGHKRAYPRFFFEAPQFEF